MKISPGMYTKTQKIRSKILGKGLSIGPAIFRGLLFSCLLMYSMVSNGMDSLPLISSSQDSCRLDSPWFALDIGITNIPGTACIVADSARIQASGLGFQALADHFNFVYQEVSGNIIFSAKLDSQTFINSNSRAGLMIRKSLDPGSTYAMMAFRPSVTGTGAYFDRRSVDNRSNSYSSRQADPSLSNNPGWLQVRRTGTSFVGYYSNNGSNWVALDSVEICMPDKLFVGFALTSADNSQVNTASFSEFSLSSTPTLYQRIYVDSAATTGANNGSDWANAFTDLQSALSSSCGVDTIWIAKGTYTPDPLDDTKSFELTSSTVLYGGFAGTESQLSQRLMDSISLHVVNQTILSGDIGILGNSADNSLHVISVQTTGASPQLNGLSIAYGNAKGLSRFPIPTNTPEAHGGGIYVTNASISLDNCLFYQNRAYSEGGALYIEEGRDSIKINACHFERNTAGSFFVNGNGGAIRINSQNNVGISASTFVENIGGNGGGLKLFRSTSTLKDCKFIRNEALGGDQNGGGVNLGAGKHSFSNCEFRENKSRKGGGLSSSNGEVAFINCLFLANLAEGDTAVAEGGAIRMVDGNSTYNNCTFDENWSKGNGGAIHHTDGDPVIELSTFNHNISDRSGGALYTSGVSDPVIHLSQFVGNKAIVSGGAASHAGTSLATYKFSLFEADTVSKREFGRENGGGAINANEASLIIDTCEFRTSFSGTRGGAVFSSDGNLTIRGSQFFGNHSIRDGGAILREQAAAFVSSDNYFEENRSDSVGGGLALNNITGSVQIIRNTFARNQAFMGGGIGNIEGGNFELINCTFSQNNADKGGGIYAEAAYNMSHCTLFENTALEGGGIIGVDTANLRMDHCLIAANTDTLNINPDVGISTISRGYNLIGNTNVGSVFFEPTDLLGDAASPIDPRLDILANYGGSTPVHALMAESPARAKGASIQTTFAYPNDQRGYSRIKGSGEDSTIDIGAFEWQRTFVSAPDRSLCEGDTRFLALGNISLIDSTGGAFGIGDSLTMVLKLPGGFTFQSNSGNIICEGMGLSGCEIIDLQADSLLIRYNRTYDTELNAIRLQNLKVNVSGQNTAPSLTLIRTGGNAIQYENQPGDSLLMAQLRVFPKVVLDTSVYRADFEFNEENWTASGDVQSWEWGMPSNSLIDTAASGVNAWITDLDSTYKPNENSAVTSPCFDFRGMLRPMIGLSIFSDTEEGFDGAVLQASFDAGLTWTPVGEEGRGISWYNSSTIIANPGEQVDTTSGKQLGWTGRDTSWRRARYRLDDLVRDSSAVRFRVAFSSINEQDPTESNNGFAFDDVQIEGRSQRALIERFRDHLQPELELDTLIRNNRGDVQEIQYGLSASPFYADNPIGPSVRAQTYGISQSSRTVVGGNTYLGLSSQLSQSDFDKSTLLPAKFEITIDSSLSEPISIHATTNFLPASELIVYVAVIENQVSSGGSMGQYLLRKFLPDPAGISFFGWQAGTIETFSPKWEAADTPNPTIIDDFNQLEVLVFVQDGLSKEIYQVESAPVWRDLIDPAKINPASPGASNSPEIYVFPNPSQGALTLAFDALQDSQSELEFFDMTGTKVSTYTLAAGVSSYAIDSDDLAKGIYLMRLMRKNQPVFQAKVVFVN